MDDMTTREVSWERLDRLVPAELDRYWLLTLEFLKIARAAWPGILAERAAIDPAARRDALIKAEALRLATRRDGPVIAAGSTGSMPATAELIASIASLPHGAVVLPGLDMELDAESGADRGAFRCRRARDQPARGGTSPIRHAGPAPPDWDRTRASHHAR